MYMYIHVASSYYYKIGNLFTICIYMYVLGDQRHFTDCLVLVTAVHNVSYIKQS